MPCRNTDPSQEPGANISHCDSLKHYLYNPQMVAALLRVIHSGVQDSRLLPFKGQPNIRFFVRAFIRAGRFTTQWVRLDFDTRPNFGGVATLTLPPKGHLISRLYLVSSMPDIGTAQAQAAAWCAANGKAFAGPTFGWTNSLGHAALGTASIEIGGARVEQIDGRLLEVLDEFYTPLEKVALMDRLLPRDSSNFVPGRFAASNQRAVTPLPFWFTHGDAGTFLPIDALYADAVKLRIGYAALNTLYVSSAQRALGGLGGTTATAAAAAAAAATTAALEEAGATVCPPEVKQPTVTTGVAAATSGVPGGEAYFPLVNSPFYYDDPEGDIVIAGLDGNPAHTRRVSMIPGIKMPSAAELVLGDCYLMAEYIYLDGPEANRFRLADIQVPVTQHYAFDPTDTRGARQASCYLKVPNPTRNLFFYLQRAEATAYNAPFLATRDLSGADAPVAPWWPNASPVDPQVFRELVPAYAFRASEPLRGLALIYEGKLYRYATAAPSIFRSLLPALEQRKAPWVNRYYYNLPFGLGSGFYPPSLPVGEANLDKIVNINLQLDLQPFAGYADPNAVPRYYVYCWAETYNVFRVYGGRGGMMFGY